MERFRTEMTNTEISFMRIKQGVQKYIALFGVFCLSILAFQNQISITVLGLTWFSVAFVALCFNKFLDRLGTLIRHLGWS